VRFHAFLIGATAAFSLAACTAAPRAPSGPSTLTGTVPAPLAQVRERIEAELRTAGLEIMSSSDSAVRAERRSAVPKVWVSCPRIIVVDRQSDFNRQSWTAPTGERVDVTVGLSPTGDQTTVTIVADFEGIYRNRYTNTPFDNPCPSTGVLEQRILASADG
jgi:hypothetical protein